MKTTNIDSNVGETIDQAALDTVTGGVDAGGDPRYQLPTRQEPIS